MMRAVATNYGSEQVVQFKVGQQFIRQPFWLVGHHRKFKARAMKMTQKVTHTRINTLGWSRRFVEKVAEEGEVVDCLPGNAGQCSAHQFHSS